MAASGPDFWDPLFTLLGAGLMFGGSRAVESVRGANYCLAQIDENARLAERQLHLHARGQVDVASLAEVFTVRSELGLKVERIYGRSNLSIINALDLFSQALDACDPNATGSVPMGGDPTLAIENVRLNQQAFRSAISRTFRGRIGSLVGSNGGKA